MSYATFQLRGYCSPAGYARLDTVLGMLCGLGNTAIQQRRDAWRTDHKHIYFNDQSKLLTEIRANSLSWAAIDTHVARGALRRVDKAFAAFFRRCKSGEKPGYPRYKSRRRYDCVEVRDVKPANVRQRADGRVIVRFKGMRRIECVPSRPLPPGIPKAVRIVRRPAGCTVDLVYAVEPQPLLAASAAVGIDMGVRKRLTLSNGEVIAPAAVPRQLARRTQRAISRCRRGSKTRQKRILTLRRIRRRQAVRNRNECHRITTSLVRRFGRICIEDLQVQNMSRSASGTADSPGTNVSQKRGLNRSILEQTWGLIRQQLAYKAAWAGRELRVVNPAYTSRICSICGVRGSPGSAEQWTCEACGTTHDRDVNAARNILRAGSAPSVRQAAQAQLGPEILSHGRVPSS